MISKKVLGALDLNICWARSLKEAVSILGKYQNNFFAALLDYTLPDSSQGEIVDEVLSRNIPSIVFTGNVTEDARRELWRKGIVDYVVKDDKQSLEYLIFLLSRLEKNSETKVLVVDDSKFFRRTICRLLEIQKYRVLEAENGAHALRVIRKNPDTKLVITDYSMPEMDGFNLTKRLRRKYGRDGIAILGVTVDQNKTMGARFIKVGANDFIEKERFIVEEFYCRVTQSLQNLEYIQMTRDLATKDYLTGLYNRRYFYEVAEKLYASARRNKIDIACAMIDIDQFKNINDSHGHEVGDKALQHISKILLSHLQRTTDLIARMGGEEFCIMTNDISAEDSVRFFQGLCQAIEARSFEFGGGHRLKITISIGISTELGSGLDDMLRRADRLLYQAKARGRNQVVSDRLPQNK